MKCGKEEAKIEWDADEKVLRFRSAAVLRYKEKRQNAERIALSAKRGRLLQCDWKKS